MTSGIAGAHLLEVEDLSVDFPSEDGLVHALRNVSWHVDPGETLAILGESGSGKSVTASAVMDLLQRPPAVISSGRILFRGHDLLRLKRLERRRLNGTGLCMVFQDPLAALNPVYPVGWQIGEPLRRAGMGRDAVRARVLALMARVGIPSPQARYGDYPHQFSGGQRQRIVIAMALIQEPKLLIADEPTTALDVTIQATVLRLMRDLRDETGMGLVLITHDLGVAAEHSDRVVVMRDGQVVEAGDTASVLSEPRHAYTRQLLAAMPGREGFPPPRPVAPPLLELSGLRKTYRLRKRAGRGSGALEVRALDDVSLTVERGEIVAVVGESGSGKSTMANTVLGLVTPDAGAAHLDGESLIGTDARGRRRISRRLQAVFQDPASSLDPRMTVERIVSEPWRVHSDALPRHLWDDRVGALLAAVGLPETFRPRYPDELSGGQKQRVAIARALALDPDLIVCDEAVSALDVSVQAQIVALLKRLGREQDLAYLFITHDLNVVRDFADRVVVMCKGRIVENGPTSDVFEASRGPYTRSLLAAAPNFEEAVTAAAMRARHLAAP